MKEESSSPDRSASRSSRRRVHRCGRRTAHLSWLTKSILTSYSPVFRDTPIDASFYPYVGLTHSIRRRGKGWVIRVSDHCQDAPRAVLEAIVSMLACKILRRKSPRGAVRAYEAFRADPAVQEAVRRRRRERGYKRLRREPGTHHSLEEILQEVNRSQFHGQIEIDRVGWGVHASWSRLGHYDPVHQSITISPVLDSPKVPEYVVSYILFHELLHALFEGRETGGLHHTPEFRKAEKAYPDYAAAQDFLRRFVRNRGSWPGSS